MSAMLAAPQLDEGRKLIEHLDSRRFPVRVAVWLRLDPEPWRLVLASELGDELGCEEAQRELRAAVSGFPGELAQLAQVSLVGLDDEIVSLFRKAVSTGDEISSIRFSRKVIEGHYIDDAFIYRCT